MKYQDSDEAADEVNSLPESQRMSNNDIVEAVDQDDNITIVTINSNNVVTIDSGDKVTEVFDIESTKVKESEPENPEAPPEEKDEEIVIVTELLSGETISKLSIGCPVELLEENIEELSDEDEIFEIKRTLPRPEQVEADQKKYELLPAEEISDDHISDSKGQ